MHLGHRKRYHYPATTDNLSVVTDQRTERQAQQLVDQIMRNARADNQLALLEIDADPETSVLLDLLPDRTTRGPETHLEGARIWRRQQNKKALSKFDAAQAALDGLDVPLAKGILRKIDSRILGETELARFDELLLATEARAAELEQIEKQIPTSPKKQKRRGRFRND